MSSDENGKDVAAIHNNVTMDEDNNPSQDGDDSTVTEEEPTSARLFSLQPQEDEFYALYQPNKHSDSKQLYWRSENDDNGVPIFVEKCSGKRYPTELQPQ